MNAPLPTNEAARIQSLHDYQILDTLPETAFERITTLAAQLFDTPMSTVSMVDVGRQWFKACFGVDRRETSRELSFCAYAILSDEVMVVPDATVDPRFRDNALVTGKPHIRFYAGAPLKAPDGHNLGSICVMDTRPRQFSTEQQAMLAGLAAIVVDELELRRTGRELREQEATLREALRINNQLGAAVANATTGILITDPNLPDNPIIFANAAFCDLTGYSREAVLGHNCRFLQGAKTDPQMVAQFREAITARQPFTGIILNYRQDGTSFLNELRVTPVFDAEGELQNFVGLQYDVTAREQAKQLLEQQVKERTADLALSQIEILKRLARAAEFRDDDTGQHTQRVARTSALLGRAIGLPAEQVEWLEQAAPLHDVGKIAVSDQILLKPGKLTEEEYATMKTHAPLGAALLSDGRSEVVQMAERIAGSHHERWDGNGYPQGLSGEHISIENRLLAVADVFDALTHDRPYKSAWSIVDAVAEISRQTGRQFDPRIVEAFMTLSHDVLL